MGKGHFFVQLTREETLRLGAFIKETPSGRVHRRAQAIWFSCQGQTVQQIAQLLAVSERSVWNWLAAYRKEGLKGLPDKPIPGRKPCLTPQQQAKLVAITRQSPATAGLSGYTWNCRLLRQWLQKTFHIHLSDEWVRQILLKHGLRFRRPKLVLTSPDPAYTPKKRRLTA